MSYLLDDLIALKFMLNESNWRDRPAADLVPIMLRLIQIVELLDSRTTVLITHNERRHQS